MTDGFKAWVIPADKREEYFEIIDRLQRSMSHSRQNDIGYDAYSDPVVTFRNFDYIPFHQAMQFIVSMKEIGAEDITEHYLEVL